MTERIPALVAAALGLLGLVLALGRGGLLGWVFALFLLFSARAWRSPRPGDGRRLAKAVAAVFGGILVTGVAMVGAWETEEVIVLRQQDDTGEPFERRLWIVDHRGIPSFAARPPEEQRRIGLLERHPRVELVRGGRTECRIASLVAPDEAMGREVERLYDEKYGFRVKVAGPLILKLLGGATDAPPVIVQLLPCPEAA
jgi:hypothetical protein